MTKNRAKHISYPQIKLYTYCDKLCDVKYDAVNALDCCFISRELICISCIDA